MLRMLEMRRDCNYCKSGRCLEAVKRYTQGRAPRGSALPLRSRFLSSDRCECVCYSSCPTKNEDYKLQHKQTPTGPRDLQQPGKSRTTTNRCIRSPAGLMVPELPTLVLDANCGTSKMSSQSQSAVRPVPVDKLSTKHSEHNFGQQAAPTTIGWGFRQILPTYPRMEPNPQPLTNPTKSPDLKSSPHELHFPMPMARVMPRHAPRSHAVPAKSPP